LHASAIVTGDDFLLDYDFDIDASDITDFILTWDFTDGSLGPKYGLYHFDYKWGANFAKITTPFGHCFSFNNVNANEFYNLEL
jgi:hypothetical protein